MIACTSQTLTGWGRTAPSRSLVVGPGEPERLQELLATRPARGVVGRGAGRSYGDAAQNLDGYVVGPVTQPGIELDVTAGILRASASTSFADILASIVPHGLILPVLPGTCHLTIGGAVAADVHGKNQRREGSIAAWIDELELLDGRGDLRVLTPGGDPVAFQATLGGMGLTGIILAVKLRLLRVHSAMMRVTSRRFGDLDALLAALDAADSRYSVAWVDTTASGRSLGRGVLDTGDHLACADPRLEPEGPCYHAPRARRAPSAPFCAVTPWTARGFNSLWFRKAPREHSGVASLASYFHRLDAIEGWNRAIGPRGLIQYQFVVPEGQEEVIGQALETVQRFRCAPFLGTLKRFGPPSGGGLSFPVPGWSLAIDMPAGNPALVLALEELDRDVSRAGGRVYLAKDARLSRNAFERMYPEAPAWRKARAQLDPHGVFQSDLGRRLGLCG
ncbi:MAG TPA: FAD-binding oxidoreductase [Streptosporangiaceae bacterium]|nr:FAD-binding oxidoreductase [Streptosporangiaceae bacterium]